MANKQIRQNSLIQACGLMDECKTVQTRQHGADGEVGFRVYLVPVAHAHTQRHRQCCP